MKYCKLMTYWWILQMLNTYEQLLKKGLIQLNSDCSINSMNIASLKSQRRWQIGDNGPLDDGLSRDEVRVWVSGCLFALLFWSLGAGPTYIKFAFRSAKLNLVATAVLSVGVFPSFAENLHVRRIPSLYRNVWRIFTFRVRSIRDVLFHIVDTCLHPLLTARPVVCTLVPLQSLYVYQSPNS
jgi:hypothetical protein